VAGLHDARMQIEIMRHDRRADDAERYIKHVRIADDIDGGRKAANDLAPFRLRHQDLDQEAERDDAEQRYDERLDAPKTLVLEIEHQKHVGGGDDDADFQRNAEQQIEADGGADDFGEVGGANRQFRQKPERPGEETRIG